MKLRRMFEEAMPIISKVAPSIGAAIGGPVGLATGYAIPILAKAFDNDPSDLHGLVNKIVNDPDSQTKLCEIEHQHKDVICTLMDSVKDLASAEIHVKLAWN